MLDTEDKRLREIEERIEAMGQDSEKQGIKWTKYFMDQFDTKELEKNQIKEERLDKRSKFTRKEYTRVCREMLDQEVKALERPGPGFWVNTTHDRYGVRVNLHDRYGRIFSRGFKPSGIPKADLHAINLFMGWTQDKMWEVEESDKVGDIYVK